MPNDVKFLQIIIEQCYGRKTVIKVMKMLNKSLPNKTKSIMDQKVGEFDKYVVVDECMMYYLCQKQNVEKMDSELILKWAILCCIVVIENLI